MNTKKMNPKPSSKRKDPSTWCPKCAWYKGLYQPLCTHCGFNEEIGGVEAIKKEKPISERGASKREGLKISPILIVIILIGFGVAYAGLQVVQRADTGGMVSANDFQDQTRLVTPAPALEDIPNEPVSTAKPKDMTPPIENPLADNNPREAVSPTEEPEETIKPTSEIPSTDPPDLTGKWVISYGNLSTFSNLLFIGDGEFKTDGTYKITSHPREFDPSEGIIEFTGRYTVEGMELTGAGKSAITQEGRPFGAIATDRISGKVEPSKDRIEGVIESVSSFHEGGGEETAVFEFILERN
jgi:hypothetical protein